MSWCVYILRCEPDTLYTGSTPDLARRMQQHCGKVPGGAKYTRSHPPLALAAVWETQDAHTARSIEWHIKRLDRRRKLALIADPLLLQDLLGDCAASAAALDPTAYQKMIVD